MNSKQLGQVIGFGLLGVALAGLLGNIAGNQKVSPNLRFVAQTAEGMIVQDLETGLFHLLVA